MSLGRATGSTRANESMHYGSMDTVPSLILTRRRMHDQVQSRSGGRRPVWIVSDDDDDDDEQATYQTRRRVVCRPCVGIG